MNGKQRPPHNMRPPGPLPGQQAEHFLRGSSFIVMSSPQSAPCDCLSLPVAALNHTKRWERHHLHSAKAPR